MAMSKNKIVDSLRFESFFGKQNKIFFVLTHKFRLYLVFIKSVIPELNDVNPKLIHTENGVQSNLFVEYPEQIVSIAYSRTRAIEVFKKANSERN